MPYVKPDGTIVYGDGTTGRLTPQEMEARDRHNRAIRQARQRPAKHDNKAGLMQEYIDPEMERRVAKRLLDGLTK